MLIDKRAAILGSRIQQRGYDPAARVPAPVVKRVLASIPPMKKSAPVVATGTPTPVTCCKYCHVGGDLVILYKDRLVCTNCEQTSWFSSQAQQQATKRVAPAARSTGLVDETKFPPQTWCEKCGADRPNQLVTHQVQLECKLCGHLTWRWG